MDERTDSGRLLDRVYSDLGYGHEATESVLTPSPGDRGWLEVGDWLMLAARMGAERVFFVRDEPVILFRELPAEAGEAEVVQAYKSAWSLGRARCLFLATESELRVYSLDTPPARSQDEAREMKALQVVSRAADVAELLAAYHRDRVESGAFFDHVGQTTKGGQSDRQLVSDVEQATKALVDAKLKPAAAHALIERVLLVRYLEDRGVITRAYFEEIAERHPKWQTALRREPESPQFGTQSLFANCLRNKALTFSVFNRLAQDFNGDLFVPIESEVKSVRSAHLELVRRMLTGAGGDKRQEKLFLWAYDFSVVPTSLISALYEQFYRAGTQDDSGTYYTPPELAEHVLALTLSDTALDKSPRVVDPTCGSGIFLVEAFRRIVRHAMSKAGRRLDADELRKLLTSRLAGVDINAEAVRLAAFSLYLAYLNYQTPQDIRSAGALPRLLDDPDSTPLAATSPVLFVGDAFTPFSDELDSEEPGPTLPWSSRSFDVVVGNPPWTHPKSGPLTLGEKWADKQGLSYANRDPSQLFLWRSLDFIDQNGVVALLVGAGAIHNARGSQFRRQWLGAVTLGRVVDFAATREIFFSGAIAPFLLLEFGHGGEAKEDGSPTRFETVLPSRALRASKSMAYARTEQRWVPQAKLRSRDYLWKTYAWGNHHDDALLARLDVLKSIRDVVPVDPGPGYGFQRGGHAPSATLSRLRSLSKMRIWGPLQPDWFESRPEGVKRQPDERRYAGQRIVMMRGAMSGFGPVARLEREPFAFRHTVYCLPLPGVPDWQARIVLGVILSSVGRYRLFMTSGSWGLWHDSFVPRDVLDLPIRLPDGRASVTRRIGRAVDDLQRAAPGSDLLVDGDQMAGRLGLDAVLERLDEAVFDLFEMTPGERDRVRDFHRYTLDLVTRKSRSHALDRVSTPAESAGLRSSVTDATPLNAYLAAFLDIWNRELGPEGEFAWYVVPSDRSNLLGVAFETQVAGDGLPILGRAEALEWEAVLGRLEVSLDQPISRRVRRADVAHVVTDTSITVIKANEARLWSASAARVDAEATILRAMALQSS